MFSLYISHTSAAQQHMITLSLVPADERYHIIPLHTRTAPQPPQGQPPPWLEGQTGSSVPKYGVYIKHIIDYSRLQQPLCHSLTQLNTTNPAPEPGTRHSSSQLHSGSGSTHQLCQHPYIMSVTLVNSPHTSQCTMSHVDSLAAWWWDIHPGLAPLSSAVSSHLEK